MKGRILAGNCTGTWGIRRAAQATLQGKAAVLENPRRSYFWNLREARKWHAQKSVFDVEYDACCFGGARCKRQLLRTNVECLWRLRCKCRHVHTADEWTPQKLNGRWQYATGGEAEFTAELAFAIAIALSEWAVRTGRAKLRIPARPPGPVEYGDRTVMLRIPHEFTRLAAMPGVALRCGCRPLPLITLSTRSSTSSQRTLRICSLTKRVGCPRA